MTWEDIRCFDNMTVDDNLVHSLPTSVCIQRYSVSMATTRQFSSQTNILITAPYDHTALVSMATAGQFSSETDTLITGLIL